ncbi:E3 ubiquitin-protein ligase RNF14 [Hordeum vulgare]|nr:E3 ubiquitin-protein ligase RNF14 [Hordeum vulgare]
MAAASAGAPSSSRAMVSHRIPDPGFSTEASSSSSSPSSRADGSDEDVLNLDSPWVAATEAESRLEEAAATARIHLEEEEEEEGIRVNQERQQDEVQYSANF